MKNFVVLLHSARKSHWQFADITDNVDTCSCLSEPWLAIDRLDMV
jgi:hypothetical protein